MTGLAFALVSTLWLAQVPTPAAATVQGTTVDAGTAAPIPNAQVTIVELARAVRTGGDGRFVFERVPPGDYPLTVSIIGYVFVRRPITVTPRGVLQLTVPLSEGTGVYQETVRITPPPEASAEPGVSAQAELGSASLQDLRSIAADDPMRAVQALPGVATSDDFQSQFSVRGSEFRHVGVVFDGTATPLLLHTVRSTNDTASIAMIDTDVLDRASLLSGAHPQRHGDWPGATRTGSWHARSSANRSSRCSPARSTARRTASTSRPGAAPPSARPAGQCHGPRQSRSATRIHQRPRPRRRGLHGEAAAVSSVRGGADRVLTNGAASAPGAFTLRPGAAGCPG